jgi:hypothetical protein
VARSEAATPLTLEADIHFLAALILEFIHLSKIKISLLSTVPLLPQHNLDINLISHVITAPRKTC